jgi:hypothetical protein
MSRRSLASVWLAACPIAACAAGVQPPPAPPQSLTVSGSEFVLTLPDGSRRRSADLVGARLKLPGGATLLIDAVQREQAPGGELWLHEVSLLKDDGSKQPLCDTDAKGQRLALVVPGALGEDSRFHAREGEFSFTCTAGVQAKCLRAGYLPWSPREGVVSMGDLFQACTRMMRADYCGDNEAHTRNGTLIDLFDDAGIQKPERGELVFEAGWGPQGAVCVHHVRIREIFSLQQLIASCPRLAEVAHGPACTEDAARRQGAIVFNRSAAAP